MNLSNETCAPTSDEQRIREPSVVRSREVAFAHSKSAIQVEEENINGVHLSQIVDRLAKLKSDISLVAYRLEPFRREALPVDLPTNKKIDTQEITLLSLVKQSRLYVLTLSDIVRGCKLSLALTPDERVSDVAQDQKKHEDTLPVNVLLLWEAIAEFDAELEMLHTTASYVFVPPQDEDPEESLEIHNPFNPQGCTFPTDTLELSLSAIKQGLSYSQYRIQKMLTRIPELGGVESLLSRITS